MSRQRGTRLIALCSVVLVATLLADSSIRSAPAAAGQTQRTPVYRAGVDLVVLNVAVLDDDGEPVIGLTAEDFVVREDGAAQELTLFASSRDTPIDVALVLDMSASVAVSAPTVKEDARAFLAALGPQDCVYFVPFRDEVHAGTWSAPSEPALLELVERLPLQGGTALYDALARALTNVDRTRYVSLIGDDPLAAGARFDGPFCGAPLPPPNLGIPASTRRTAIVVISDGGDEHSVSTYADTLVGTWSSSVPMFSVAIGDALAPRRRRVDGVGTIANRMYRRELAYSEALENRLGQLAHISGGRLVLGRGRDAVREAFEEVVKMLRSTYLVGYNAPSESADGEAGRLSWHRLDVELPAHDAEVYVRPGYYRNLWDTAGAARIVRETPALLAEGRQLEAVEQLDLAARLDPGYWPLYLQRARALLRIGRPAAARDDLLRALELRPGMGSVHALLADTAVDLGDWELAWYHVIRAAQDGYDATSVLRRLQTRSRPPADLTAQLRALRVFVDVGPTPDELDQGALLELLRLLRQEMSMATDIALVSEAVYANVAVILEPSEVEGRPRKLEAELVVYAASHEAAHREDLDIDDVDDPQQRAAAVREAVRKVREWIADNRR